MTSDKFDIFSLHPNPNHSGQSVSIQNCLGEFGMDTWQPLMITTMRITHIFECTFISICIIILCHMDSGENFGLATKRIFFVIRWTVFVPGVCPCISICAMMHHMHTGEVAVTSDKI